ncbi:MAG: chorismate mutase [Bacteroidia bacterium]
MVLETLISKQLAELRNEIDEVDLKIMELLLKRFYLAKQAAQEKTEFSRIYDAERELQIIESAFEFFNSCEIKVSKQFIADFFKAVLDESKRQLKSEFIKLHKND